MNTSNNTSKYILDGKPTINSNEVDLDIYLPNGDYLTVKLETEYDSYSDCVTYEVVETYLTDCNGDDVEHNEHDVENIVEIVWSENDLSDKSYMVMVDNYHSGR